MKRASWFLSLAASALAVGMACSKQSPTPVAPTSIDPALIEANADGSILKVTQPTLRSPINGERLEQGTNVVLVVGNSTTTFANPVALTYRFELMDAAGGMVESALVAGGSGTTSRPIDSALLEGELTYSWRVRAEYQGIAGPWSSVQSFVAPPTLGYIRGNELYDPLFNGQTVGEIHGPVRFIPGVGVQILTEESYISYSLPQAVTTGEYSVLMTGLTNLTNTEDPKLRVISMRQGDAAINDNRYRMTVEKRGNGAIAWRFITGDAEEGEYIDTIGAERVSYRFQEHLTYLLRASWNGGFFRVQWFEGGAAGNEVYNFGKGYGGVYNPNPHNVYIGSPWKPGDRGEPASYDGMIVRQVWVSPNPRPSYANK
jgi:hypothetical protein